MKILAGTVISQAFKNTVLVDQDPLATMGETGKKLYLIIVLSVIKITSCQVSIENSDGKISIDDEDFNNWHSEMTGSGFGQTINGG